MTTESQIKMAAQLYDMRDKAKMLLGDKYKGHMEMLGRILKDISRQKNKPVLAVAIDHCKKRELTGMEFLFTMAAAVELEEPTS